jgi:hypothetical protein
MPSSTPGLATAVRSDKRITLPANVKLDGVWLGDSPETVKGILGNPDRLRTDSFSSTLTYCLSLRVIYCSAPFDNLKAPQRVRYIEYGQRLSVLQESLLCVGDSITKVEELGGTPRYTQPDRVYQVADLYALGGSVEVFAEHGRIVRIDAY